MSPNRSTPPPTRDQVRQALRTVIDPEVGVDIVTLGLVYDVTVLGGDVTVTFTLTTPGCPLQGILTESVCSAVQGLAGVEHVYPKLTWEPRWHPGMMEENPWSTP